MSLHEFKAYLTHFSFFASRYQIIITPVYYLSTSLFASREENEQISERKMYSRIINLWKGDHVSLNPQLTTELFPKGVSLNREDKSNPSLMLNSSFAFLK